MSTKKVVKKVVEAVAKQQNTATISCLNMPGDMIVVTGFDNFLTIGELAVKYGNKISDIYLAHPDSFVKRFNPFTGEGCVSIQGEEIEIGDVFDKKDFSKIISSIKMGGKALAEIIAICGNPSLVRKIKI